MSGSVVLTENIKISLVLFIARKKEQESFWQNHNANMSTPATINSTSWVNNTQTRTKTSQVTSNWLINSVRNLIVSLSLKDNAWRLNYSPFSYQIASSTPQVNKRLLHGYVTNITSLATLLPYAPFQPHFRNTCPWMPLSFWRLFLSENRNVLTEERSAWHWLADLLCVTQFKRSAVFFLLMARLKTTTEMYFANMNCLQSSILVRSF